MLDFALLEKSMATGELRDISSWRERWRFAEDPPSRRPAADAPPSGRTADHVDRPCRGVANPPTALAARASRR